MVNRMLNGVVIIVMCITILLGCDSMKFDQTTKKDDLLTKKHSITQIEELKSALASENITFSKFKRTFYTQCVRKTHQGYYVVLLLENNSNAFVFFNEDNIITQVIISSGFKSKLEFQTQVVKQMPQSQVLDFDSNTILMPISAIETTVHIVQEGICIVEYTRLFEGKIIEDPIVTSVAFVGNDDISTNEYPFLRDVVPFIHKVDK